MANIVTGWSDWVTIILARTQPLDKESVDGNCICNNGGIIAHRSLLGINKIKEYLNGENDIFFLMGALMVIAFLFLFGVIGLLVYLLMGGAQ